MLPYNYNIKTMDDVRKAYNYLNPLDFINKADAIKLIEKEYRALKADEEYYTNRKIPKATLIIMKEVATCRGLYRYLWGVENTTEVMLKWGWKASDIVTLMEKAKKAGFNPFNEKDDAVGHYIESIPGYGYTMKTVEDKTFTVYVGPR